MYTYTANSPQLIMPYTAQHYINASNIQKFSTLLVSQFRPQIVLAAILKNGVHAIQVPGLPNSNLAFQYFQI